MFIHCTKTRILLSYCYVPAWAFNFCREVDFVLYEKEHTAIGFANDAGGYELRSQHFKGSNSPKSPTTLQEYKLIPALEKNLKLTHLENLSETEANKYKIYIAISESLPHCRTMEELQKRLLKSGIETKYKYKGQTQEKQGVSFKIGDDCFKGSEVDRKFSLGNLQKTLSLNQIVENVREKQQTTELQSEPAAQKLMRERLNANQKTTEPQQDTTGKDLAGELAKGLGKAFEILMKPEETHDDGVNEFLLERNRYRKKQSRKPKRQ